MKVLFAAAECAPIIKVGGLADVVGSLPKALSKLGVEVAIALPNYGALAPNPPPFLPGTKIALYYLGQPTDFPGDPYPGGEAEPERFANFCRLVINFLETRAFEPELIHCHDYHTGLIPDLIQKRQIKVASLLTIHDVENRGESNPGVLESATLSRSHLKLLDFDLKDGQVDLLLQGILAADVINTVSPTYAREILKEQISGRLADPLRAREGRLYGVLNGLDPDFYNPLSDPFLSQNYSLANFERGKEKNKVALLSKLDFPENAYGRPLLAMVARLVRRKGLDLVLKALPRLLESGASLVVLGRGEPEYEKKLKEAARNFKGKLTFVKAFDEALAHQIYAAADFFLVPSLTEPCGLTQMIAQRYGSLPIVHGTGGLADTVFETVNGYLFDSAEAEVLLSTVKRAIEVRVKDPSRHLKMIVSAMKMDFSWDKSALIYLTLYRKALEYSFGMARGVGGEIRHDVLGGWSILAEGRAKRPSSTGNRKSFKSCPFDEGHEKESPGEVFRVGPGEPDTPGWQVRVIPNKYPLLPAHEVIIHSPDHDKDLSQLPLLWVEKVVWAYLSRYRHYEPRGFGHIFCNHGLEAAASLSHSHSQLVVLDDLPKAALYALEAAKKYYEERRCCPYCRRLTAEVPGGPRFIYQNASFVLLTPYASDWPFELNIFPKSHRQSFGNIKEAELKDLAQILQTTIKLIKSEFGDLSYNYWIHSVPDLLGFAKSALYYHWHLELIPRIKKLGGLELGAGVMVDDLTSPEGAALQLREKLKDL